MIHVDRQIFGLQRFGYGSALLWLIFVVIATLTVLVFKTEKYWVHSEVSAEGRHNDAVTYARTRHSCDGRSAWQCPMAS